MANGPMVLCVEFCLTLCLSMFSVSTSAFSVSDDVGETIIWCIMETDDFVIGEGSLRGDRESFVGVVSLPWNTAEDVTGVPSYAETDETL